MLTAYEWGLKFLELFALLEDFFLYKPFADMVKASQVIRLINLGPSTGSFDDQFAEFVFSFFGSLSMGEIIVSGSVIGILIFKIFKFIIGFITGS